jgi:hypothetical protein
MAIGPDQALAAVNVARIPAAMGQLAGSCSRRAIGVKISNK